MRWYLLLFLLLCCSSFSSAFSFPSNNSFLPGESFLLSFDSSFLYDSFSFSDISFFEGRRSVPFAGSVFSFGNDSFVTVLTDRPGNFSLVIGPLLFRSNGSFVDRSFEYNFSVRDTVLFEGNVSGTRILRVDPLVVSSGGVVELFNRGSFSLNVSFLDEDFVLLPSSSRVVSVPVVSEVSSFVVSSYDDWSILVVPDVSVPVVDNVSVPSFALVPVKSYVSLVVSSNGSSSFVVPFDNVGSRSVVVSNVSSNVSSFFLFRNQSFPVGVVSNLSVVVNPLSVGSFSGFLNVSFVSGSKRGVVLLPLLLEVLGPGEVLVGEDRSFSCVELGGLFCDSGFGCNGSSKISSEGRRCCLSSCVLLVDDDSSGSSGVIIGVVILVLLFIVGFFVWRRQRSVKPSSPLSSVPSSR